MNAKPLRKHLSQAVGLVFRCGSGWFCGSLLPLLFLFAMAPPGLLAGEGPQLELHKSVSPEAVASGGRVTYTIQVRNADDASAEGLSVLDELPPGFSYQPGSSVVAVNGATVSTADPTIMGNKLTWTGLRLPGGRSDSIFGIHTFVQRRTETGYLDYQLNRARELMGSGAFVTQLFDWLDPTWVGPQNWMRDFVGRAYDRSLTPVVRLAGGYSGQHWYKPRPDPDGSYTTWAQTFKRVVEGLPRRDGHRLFVQIWNEPNLHEEWEGQANSQEYGRFLADAFDALQSIGDARIVVLNAPLSPGAGGEVGVNHLEFLDTMLEDIPGTASAFHVWASHPYPNNHPPEYNTHSGTAAYRHATIDSYQQELEVLASHGRSGVKVLLTETGYALYQADFAFEGYAPINETNRADYILRAFRDHWSQWPEVIGVCPYELVDPAGQWWTWDWLWPDGRSHEQYDTVKAMEKALPAVGSVLEITFQANAPQGPGTFFNKVTASAANAPTAHLDQAAPVTVLVPTPTSTASPTATPTVTQPITTTPSTTASSPATPLPTHTATPICVDLIVNGGFESGEVWELPSTDYPAGYTTVRAHSGMRSVRLGIDTLENVRSYSSAWQPIDVPADTLEPLLTFWSYVHSGDTAGDYRYAVIQNEQGVTLEWLFKDRSNGQAWNRREFSLGAHRGTTIRFGVGVFNDGLNGRTAMYLDDVSLLACAASPTPTASPSASVTTQITLSPTQSPTPSPSATASATPSATPTRTATPLWTSTATISPTPGCEDLVVNGGFEWDGSWEIPQTAHPGGYSASLALSGQRSILLGIESGENVYSYSSIRQLVHVPADAPSPVLTFWYYPVSGDPEHDLQYTLLQNALGESDWVFRSASNTQTWTRWEHPLPEHFRGSDVTIHFGVVNDGGGAVTRMYVDNVALVACSTAPTASPTGPPLSAHTFLPLILRGLGSTASSIGVSSGPASAFLGPVPVARVVWRAPATQTEDSSLDAFAIDPRAGQYYVAIGDSLWIIDQHTGQTSAQIHLGTGARAVAVDPDRSLVYATLWQANALAVIDASSQTLRRIVSGIPGPSGVAIGAQEVYVAASGSDELLVMSADNCTIMNRISVGDAPYAVVADRTRDRVFVGSAGTNTVSILDGAKGWQASVVVLGGMGHPHGLAFDPLGDRLYVTYALSPKHRAIAAVDPASGQVLERLISGAEASLFAAYAIAVDPLTSWVYVASADQVWVLSGESLRVLHAMPGAGPVGAFGIQLDAASGRLYLADPGHNGLITIGDSAKQP